MELVIAKTQDFEITGSGDEAIWNQTEWHDLSPLQPTSVYRTRFKVLYSATGIYFLMDCEDQKLTCTLTEDLADLFTEDVMEIFLQPDEGQPIYLEYEISPLGFELPILVSNNQGKFHGWLPWHYSGPRKVRCATVIQDGEKAPLAKCAGWTAEVFIPFALMHGCGNLPVESGTRWRGNIYRIDYDGPKPAQWAWAPEIGRDFHDFSRFGVIRFA